MADSKLVPACQIKYSARQSDVAITEVLGAALFTPLAFTQDMAEVTRKVVGSLNIVLGAALLHPWAWKQLAQSPAAVSDQQQIHAVPLKRHILSRYTYLPDPHARVLQQPCSSS